MEKHSELMSLIYIPGDGIPDKTRILRLLATKKLILSGLNIKEVPSSVCDLMQLEILDLQTNSISSLPKDFGRLKNLRVLNLSQNAFTSVPECILELTNLTSLSIANNRIADLGTREKMSMLDVLTSANPEPAQGSNKLSQLARLEELDLSGNRIRHVPAEIFCLPHIRRIKLAKNMISRLPESPSVSSSLIHVDLKSNQLSSAGQFPFAESRIKVLDLSDNFFREIPDSLFECESLCKLNLEKNAISSLDKSMERSRLTHLDLGSNQLRSFTESIGFPETLQYLSLRNNSLENLPDTVFEVPLVHLDVSLNSLGSISDKLSKMKSLKYLDISDNCDHQGAFLELPGSVLGLEGLMCLRMCHVSLSPTRTNRHEMFENLRNLAVLDLSFTQLTFIPKSVFSLKDLTTFSIQGNSIGSIDDEISSLQALESLNLSGCTLKSVNERVCKLPKLKHLNISSNPLESLPEGLNLSSLVGLDVSNSLKAIAAFRRGSSWELPEIFPVSLEVLHMENCPAIFLSPEVLGRCVSIRKLDISHCGLRNVGFLSKALPNIECLDLSGNEIADFTALLHLEKLQHLSLRSNRLDIIPPEITKLSRLRTLDLSNNSIKLLQDEIKNMDCLAVLDLSGNMVKDIEVGSMEGLEVLMLRSELIDRCVLRGSMAQTSSLRIVDVPNVSCFDLVIDIEERERLRTTYLKNMHSRKCIEYHHASDTVHGRQDYFWKLLGDSHDMPFP